jgi:hypothetical protein
MASSAHLTGAGFESADGPPSLFLNAVTGGRTTIHAEGKQLFLERERGLG